MALSLRTKPAKAAPPPASEPTAPEPAVAAPSGELGSLRQQRDAFLVDAATVEARIGVARTRQQELRAVLTADGDVLAQGAAQAELDALSKIIQREQERLNALHDRAAALAPGIEQRTAERGRLIRQRARHTASLERKADLEQRLRPIFDQLVSLESDIRWQFPETAGFVKQAAMLTGKVPGEMDHLRQVVAEIDIHLMKLGE